MPYASLGILDIALVAGYDVNMHMQDTLPGRRPHVNTNVIAIGLELFVQPLALLGYQLHAGIDLFGCQVKKAGNMAARDDQGMTRTHREGVTSTISKVILQRHPARISAKQARIIGVSFYFLFIFS